MPAYAMDTTVRYSAHLPAPETFAAIDPQAIADFGNKVLRTNREGIHYVLEGAADIQEQAFELLSPVKDGLHSYLGLTAAQNLRYVDLEYDIHAAEPASPYLYAAAHWHSDGDYKSEFHIRVDDHSSTEILTGQPPAGLLECAGARTDENRPLSSEQFMRMSFALEKQYGFYSDDYLREHGMAWSQPVPGAAYILRGNHIHRSPRNCTPAARVRHSFDIYFRVDAAEANGATPKA